MGFDGTYYFKRDKEKKEAGKSNNSVSIGKSRYDEHESGDGQEMYDPHSFWQ
jgi:hypothetical protein